MKHFTKLTLFCFLLILAGCQNESTEETIQQEESQGADLRFENGEVVSDGLLEKDELLFNENSEQLVQAFAKTSNSDDCVADLLHTGFDTTVNVEVVNKPGTNAYFDISIDGGDVIQAYCSDRLPSLNEDDDFLDFTVVSSYDATVLPGGAFEGVYANPQNFDKVNWILNNIETDGAPYTYGHVQYAIWTLIEDPFINDFTDFLTPNPGDWDIDADNALGDEIVAAAIANGEGYTPGCGDKLGLLLIPEDFENKQALLIVKHIPEGEEECEDCYGKVNHITFKWDWHHDYRVRLYQRYENTHYAVKIYDNVVQPHEEISVNGANHNGTFGKWIYVYVGHCYYTKFRTDCHLKIGPGYKRGVIEVVGGTSTHGGELCEYEPPHHWCWWW
ncbi:hypothetical protein [Winogradskyella sp.]|uniref:hypothetical protein n=1 Tax=Winogradskyella sp. TaxID=1883156 RepID=UPI003BAB9F03